MSCAFSSAGGISELVVDEGVFHGWHILDGLVPEAREALERTGRFVQAVTDRAPTSPTRLADVGVSAAAAGATKA